MEIASRTRTSGARRLITKKVAKNPRAEVDLKSIASCIEGALAEVTFSARELEGVLDLDDVSWRSIGGATDTREGGPRAGAGSLPAGAVD